MKKFLKQFTPDAPLQEVPPDAPLSSKIRGLSEREEAFLRTYSGASFNQGLYRIHHIDEMDAWTLRVLKAFPGYRQHIVCFAYDWGGRHFALHYQGVRRIERPRILLFEPGTGYVYRVPANLTSFHNKQLVKRTDPILGLDFHKSWLTSGGQVPLHSECIGYKTPIFSGYGGEGKVENLEVIDMKEYWAFYAAFLVEIHKTRSQENYERTLQQSIR